MQETLVVVCVCYAWAKLFSVVAEVTVCLLATKTTLVP